MPTAALKRLPLALLLAATACARPGTAPTPAPAPCPAEATGLVDATQADSTIRLEIRYATRHNFTGQRLPGYDVPRALLRPQAAQALARVQQRLRAQGLGLKVWDAYRPVRATLAMVEWAERTGRQWVLDEGYVARRSGHNRGATLDLTLVRLSDGHELEMGTAYDDFSERAHTANATGEAQQNRQTLVRAMEAEGWQNYEKEWWHWSFPGTYDELDVPLRCF